MPVIARDAVASDHLVYAWPFPIGPEEHEVVCADDEQVVMCPAWLVGDLLNVGRHRWRTPDPMRPVHAFFVLTAPVEVSFDMVTMFMLPTTGEGIRLRATGSLQVRCTDPGLLIAQFVGLPFDAVNDGILRSVSRSVERMIARLLTRRVVMAGTPNAVTDLQMHAHILEELVAYNPAAGGVFGVELVRMGHLAVLADDGSRPLEELVPSLEWSGHHRLSDLPTQRRAASPEKPLTETARDRVPRKGTPPLPSTAVAPPPLPPPLSDDDDEIRSRRPLATTTPPPLHPVIVEPPSVPALGSSPSHKPPGRASSQPSQQATSGEIVVRQRASSTPPPAVPLAPKPPADLPAGTPVPPPRGRPAMLTKADGLAAVRPEPNPTPRLMPSVPAPMRRAAPIEIPKSTDEITQPGVPTPVPGAMRIGVSAEADQPRGAIMGIGVSHIGSSQVASGEISDKVAPGARVLVPGPNGLMQSATVRQLLQGYYELEVGSSGETIWVPINGVVPHDS
ncbi:MAG: hypothetical protein ABI591_21945 [Kofleriaceae bacterium]